MKNEYITQIDTLLSECGDIELLDFIYKLMVKSKAV